jgi:hypothetical protein
MEIESMDMSHLANWGGIIQRAQRGVQSMCSASERHMEATPLLHSVVKGKEHGP